MFAVIASGYASHKTQYQQNMFRQKMFFFGAPVLGVSSKEAFEWKKMM